MFWDATKKFQIRNLWGKNVYVQQRWVLWSRKEDLLSGLGAQRRLPEAKPWRLVRNWQMEVKSGREQCPPLGGEMYWFPQQYGEMLNLFTNLFLLFLLKIKKQKNFSVCHVHPYGWHSIPPTSTYLEQLLAFLRESVQHHILFKDFPDLSGRISSNPSPHSPISTLYGCQRFIFLKGSHQFSSNQNRNLELAPQYLLLNNVSLTLLRGHSRNMREASSYIVTCRPG